MTEPLKVSKFAQDHSPTKGHMLCGRINPKFDPKRSSLFEFLFEVCLTDDFSGASPKYVELLFDRHANWKFTEMTVMSSV